MNATKYNAMLPINIACEVKARGMKYGAVAERAGFSKQQFSDMLNGRKIIKPCDILAISKPGATWLLAALWKWTLGNYSRTNGKEALTKAFCQTRFLIRPGAHKKTAPCRSGSDNHFFFGGKGGGGGRFTVVGGRSWPPTIFGESFSLEESFRNHVMIRTS